ncbi:MAG: diguanylate cyclase [Nitrospinae bacterium]|nr:diguanylate cyclase [Nitrospinota bacterium]
MLLLVFINALIISVVWEFGLEPFLWPDNAKDSFSKISESGLFAAVAALAALVPGVLLIRNERRLSKAIADLAEDEHDLRALVENYFEGIFVIEDAKIVYANHTVEKIFGYDAAGVTGRPMQELIAPPDREQVRQRVQSGGLETLAHDVSGLRKDGSIFPMLIHCKGVHFRGRIVRVAAVRDMSDWAAAHQELRRLNTEKDFILENTELGIAHMKSNSFVWVNQRMTQMYGYSREEFANMPLRRVFARDEDYAQALVEIYDRLARGRVFEKEALKRRKDGTMFWSRVLARPADPADPTRGLIAICEDVTELRNTREEDQRHAYYDPLTGLPNRRMFVENLSRAIKRATRARTMLAVLFIDLDDFKTINDTFGHSAGDLMLKGATTRLVSSLREVDIVSRMGGDEFVAMIEDVSEQSQVDIAVRRVVSTLSEPYFYKGQDIVTTVSVGVALFPVGGKNPETLLQSADMAMYSVKGRGKNGYAFYN